jgi:hypothetical protein
MTAEAIPASVRILLFRVFLPSCKKHNQPDFFIVFLGSRLLLVWPQSNSRTQVLHYPKVQQVTKRWKGLRIREPVETI